MHVFVVKYKSDVSVLMMLLPQASLSMAPISIFSHGADEEKAETARLVSHALRSYHTRSFITRRHSLFLYLSRPSSAPSLSEIWWRALWDPRAWYDSLTQLTYTRHSDPDQWPLTPQDKILMGGGRDSSVTVTNDGATILKAIGVDNPAAKVLVGQFRV